VVSNSFEQFGAFLIFRAIGRGGMGEVFIARTPWKDCPLAAVKRLRPDVARVPNFAERFQMEAELAVRLHHQNVVGTIDVGSVNEQLYVASELILGKDTGFVGDRLRDRRQGAPLAVVIRVLLDMLSALAYVHSAREPEGEWMRLVHRDITPGNVLIGYDGISRLADFGLAKSELNDSRSLTQHGEILGTPHYLAPEVIRGEPASPASDIYGLGAVMYRVLTGIAPYQGTAAEVLIKALKTRPKPLSDLRPDLPPWFITVIHSMLDGDRIQRPNDAGMLMRRVEHAAGRFKLLLPHASVGRWLSALFEEEKESELEEYEAIAAVDAEDGARKPEGTVVLASARPDSRLEGDMPFTDDDNLEDETLLEASHGVSDLNNDETIQGAELLGLENVKRRDKPTIQTKLITENSDSGEKGNNAYILDDEADTGNFEPVSSKATPSLPGFIDKSSDRSVERGLVTMPHQSVQAENLGSSITPSFQAPSSLPSHPAPASLPPRAAPASLPSERIVPLRNSNKSASAPLPALASDEMQRMATRGGKDKRATTTNTWKKQDIWMLVAGLIFASMMGAIVAIWATSNEQKSTSPKAIAPNQENVIEVSLQARYRNVRSEMAALNERGIQTNAETNKSAALAADFLLLGQLERAALEIEKLEKALESKQANQPQ